MRKVFKDQPFSYEQQGDGRWSAVDERLGLRAIGETREEAYDRLCALVLDNIKAMSDEEFAAHLSGCEVAYMDDEGRLSEGPPAAAAG